MVNYEITVYTNNCAWASTMNYVYIKLVGTRGKSERSPLPGTSFFQYGVESCFTLSCDESLGKLLLIELDKQTSMFCPEDNWFPSKVEVKSPEGDIYRFPVHRWITDSKKYHFREGTALRVNDDHHQIGLNSREQELKERKKEYCWNEYKEGIPHCIKVDDIFSLPCEVCFSVTKGAEFGYTFGSSGLQSSLCGKLRCEKQWSSFDDISGTFRARTTKISEYIRHHWKEDAFFAYQFLNGVNPMMIRRCKALPSNFPVTDDKDFPHCQKKFADEMKKGNIFLCDYKILDGVETNTIDGNKQYLMAPLVLLQKTDDKLMPIAIQLKQKPGNDNPIFFTKDSEYDWLLAKIFVKSADFNLHQLNFHLLRTHLLAEVFAVSLLRNMPMVHPLYKLLVPHTRYTLHINVLARTNLISDDGVFTLFAACGGTGTFTLLKKSLSCLTYSSLCIPDDIAERGLEDVPNFYYRDDGLKLWNIIHKFVKGILGLYYKNDDEVQKDTELQDWIRDIFEHGFHSQTSTGIPQRFTTLDEVIKFVTMVIYTVSAQHSAVNSGQYDFGGWMPNRPLSLQRPPPTKKGEATEASMMMTFPDVNATVQIMDTLWVLSKQSSDSVPLGKYPEDNFTEEAPHKIIQEFQGDLMMLSNAIQNRNRNLDIPYRYLDPAEIENSVAI